jgi:eukaryotic-like serine/threonine-protein kinase
MVPPQVETLGEPLWIGQYRLTSRIATGGMAEIYVGRHITPQGDFGPMVAVKKLLPHLIKDTAIVRMFLNEARITSQIHHPNVVTIYELGQVGAEPYIAMELLEGRTWAELRGRAAEDGRRMPGPVALRILTEACRGLDAAHRAVDEEGQPLALVHRDFTPDNIHVGVKGEVKVIDFGIARTSAWGAGTEPGTLKGKFFYMSPEMITAKPVDHRADIFAAGVMLYEQLCGHRPFTGTSIDEVVLRIAREEPALPSSYDPAVPKVLETICLRALAKDPAARFQSLAQLVDAIEHAGGDAAPASSQAVADYVALLFPEHTDERRSTLRRAREADPSVPGNINSPMTPGRGLDAALPPPAPMLLVNEAPISRRSKWPVFAAATVVLAALGIAVAFNFKSTSRSAADRLALAEKSSGKDRVEALLELAKLPDVTEAQLGRAGTLLGDAKVWDAAATLADAWVLKSPKSLEARLLQARAAVNTRKGKVAEAAVKEAQALAPNDARPDAVLAQLRELQAESTAALEAWSKAVSKEPANAHYLARQGYWLSQIGRLDEAEAALTKASKKRPEPATVAELGFVKLRKDQREEALKLLRGVVKEKPDLLEGHYYLATVLVAKNDLGAARTEYLTADALAGADWRPLLALCQMEQLRHTAELEAAKKKLKERFPQEADALLAQCVAATGGP